MQYYVSKSGSDFNDGKSEPNALLTIQAGIDKLANAGDELIIGRGTYRENVEIRNKHGVRSHPIKVKGKSGEAVNIDGVLENFWTVPNVPEAEPKWILASTLDPAAHPDEYVSRTAIAFTENISEGKGGIKGAFIDNSATHYTRLINHSTIKDLRALNEKFGKLIEPLPAAVNCVQVLDKNGMPKKIRVDNVYRDYYYPLFYMGPGIWLNRNQGNINYSKIHIRLSPTHNNVTGLADYTGETDPNKIRLAISQKKTLCLFVGNCDCLELQNLCIRFGGEHSVSVQNSSYITFGQMRFCCSEYGVRAGKTTGFEIKNCEFDGGLPSWYFRSDRKSEYYFLDETPIVLENKVGSQTSSALITGSNNNSNLKIHHCEFRNGHDIYLPGEVEFHNNLVTNMNDDSIFFNQKDGNTAMVHHNVFTKCLTCFSFIGNENQPLHGGPWYIYRNLIDIRVPTASFRPFHPDSINEDNNREVFRYGWLHKSNGPSGSFHIFHNTILAFKLKNLKAYFTHLLQEGCPQPRTSLNNIFIGINGDSAIKRPVMMLPLPTMTDEEEVARGFPDITDGNLYHIFGTNTTPTFQSMKYNDQEEYVPGEKFDSLMGYRTGTTSTGTTSTLFMDSRDHYLPGYEANSIDEPPKFKRMTNIHFPSPWPVEDLRLAVGSPAIGKGLALPKILNCLDPVARGVVRDMGCYAFNATPLKVGIDERHSYPNISIAT